MTIAVKQWVFTLSAIGVISEAEVGEVVNIGLYLFYVLATQTLVLTPTLVYAVAPEQASRPLKVAQIWLERRNRMIAIAVSLTCLRRTLRDKRGLRRPKPTHMLTSQRRTRAAL